MDCRVLALLLPLLAGAAENGVAPEGGAADWERRYARAVVAPAKTSIYVGSVQLTTPPFVRTGDTYRAGYVAKVFPYFFSNESGELRIEIPDEALRRLEAGERIEFTGVAERTDGLTRTVTGWATPDSPAHGRLKVRVAVSRKIELIFNTQYRFADAE